MIQISRFYLPAICALFVVLISSCSTSHVSRSYGKYSAAQKRNKENRPTVEDKKYSYSTKTSKKSKNESEVLTPGHKRDDIVITAMKYTGKSYKSGGKNPETGFDCSGFTTFVFNQNGIPISGPSDKQAQLGPHKPTEQLLPGDLVFFGNEDRISHVAIVATNRQNGLEVIHSTTSSGVKIDNITNSDYWQSRFLFGVDVIKK